APVVLHEEIPRRGPELLEARTELDRRLLRLAEQKIAEVAAAIEAGEHVRAARVRVRAAVGVDAPIVAANPNRVAAPDLRYRVARRQRAVGQCRGRHVAK